MLRIALVGGGRSVQIGHAPALQALGDKYQVVAIADRDPEALERTALMLKVPPAQRYTRYQDMLLQEEIDVVDIAVPHALHRQVAEAALLSGAHLITERPLALNLRDAEELLVLAETHGKLITVLHFYLYYPPFREAIRLVREGAIGEPFLVRCEGVTGGFGAGTEAYHPEWHGDPELAGGGVWIDSGYHSVYLCTALQGVPVSGVAAGLRTVNPTLGVEDTAVATLMHTNDAISSIQVAWSVPSGGTRVFEVYGTEGTIHLDHEGHPLGVFSNATRAWHHPEITIGRAESFTGILQDVHACLRFGAPPPVDHRTALHTLEVMLAGYRSSERGTLEATEEWGTPE